MKNPLNLGNSIYQQKGVSGLSVRDGMLINNRPDGKMGITQAVELKKAIKKAEKVSTMSVAFSLGESIHDMEDCGCK